MYRYDVSPMYTSVCLSVCHVWLFMYTGWPKKSKPLLIFQTIVLKIANVIRFLRKVKVWIKHYNTIRW